MADVAWNGLSAPSIKRRRIGDRDQQSDYCDHCTLMLSPNGLTELNSEEGFKHYDKSGCRVSALGGCMLCKIISQTSSKSWREGQCLHFRSTLVRFLGSGSGENIVPARLDGLWGWHGNSGWIVRVAVYATQGTRAAEFISGRAMVTDVAGDLALSSARSWIHQCLNTHKYCHTQGIPALPSRLIDVGLEHNSPSVKLYITNPNGERGTYSALSYCWGGEQPILAKIASLDILKSGIAIIALPQTIKDEIEITRRLTIRFLWVDALCIIQDCAKDKSVEIQKMGSIYKNATITIAASFASSVVDGFLRTTRKPPPEPSYFQFPMPDGTSERISLSARHFLTPQSFLDRRGWTYQERILSPRLLQFSEKELLWSCQTEPHQTITTSSVDYVVDRTRLLSQIFNDTLRGGKSWTTSKQKVDIWNKIVTEYTKRILTDQEDRLNALMGVAHELARMWKDEYVYGLWKGLMVPLLARVASERQQQRASRAPSWSWASLDGPITLRILTQKEAIFLRVEFEPGEYPVRISLSCKLLTEKAISSYPGRMEFSVPNSVLLS